MLTLVQVENTNFLGGEKTLGKQRNEIFGVERNAI